MSKKLLVCLFILNTSLFSAFVARAEESINNEPQVSFVDANNKERQADWRVKSYPIWRVDKGEKELFLQVWIALPPLLKIEPEPGHDIRIVENISKNKSPFSKIAEIDKVMTFETQRPTSMFAFRKLGAEKEDAEQVVKIKIVFPDSFSIVKHTSNCRELGYYVIPGDKEAHPFLMSVDCLRQKNLSLIIKSSLETELMPFGDKKSDVGDSKKNKVIIPLAVVKKGLKLGEATALGEFKIIKRGLENSYKYAYRKAASHSKKFNRSLRRVQATENVDESMDSSRVFRGGLLYSKADLEVLFSFDYKPELWDGYLQAKILGPLKSFGARRQQNLYLDSTIAYMSPTTFIEDRAIIVGVGARFLRFSSLSIGEAQGKTLMAPHFSISFKELATVTENKSVDVILDYSPLLKIMNEKEWEGARFLGEASLGVWENNYLTLNLSVIYSSLQVRNRNGSFDDNKFLGGATLKW